MIAQQQSQDLGPFVLLIGLMILLIMAATVGIYVYRARVLRDNAPGSAGANSALESLRQLRDSGRISPEEFREARDKIVARAASDRPDPSSPEPAGLARPKPVQDGERRARPGFDLTGEPLPTPRRPENPDADPRDSR